MTNLELINKKFFVLALQLTERLSQRRTRQEAIHERVQRVLPARQSGEVRRADLQRVRRRSLGQDRLPRVPDRHLDDEQRQHTEEAADGLQALRYERQRLHR